MLSQVHDAASHKTSKSKGLESVRPSHSRVKSSAPSIDMMLRLNGRKRRINVSDWHAQLLEQV